MHTKRIDMMRAVSNSTSWLNVPSALAEAASVWRSSRHVGGDAMTQSAIPKFRRLVVAFPIVALSISRLAVMPQFARASPRNHETRYVNTFTRLERVLGLRRRSGGPERLARSPRIHPSTL